MSFVTDLRFALRSLLRARGLTITVVLTLALGIGANAAIFSVVRGVLLKPLTNRDEDRLIYIRQSAPGLGTQNTTFSVPEIDDLKARVKSITSFGDFSTIGFTMLGLGEPRVVSAGVVGGSYFEVMGLRPVLGRLINASDDGPQAAGVVVLTYRFWTTEFKSDPSVIGKAVRLDSRAATVIGVLEPSVPYPQDTEIIANIVTSPHHLSATMVTGRVHRMNDLVEVTGFFRKTPLLRFVQKGKGVTNLTGEKLYEAQVIDAVQNELPRCGVIPTFFVMIADDEKMSYRLLVEGPASLPESSLVGQAVDRRLAELNIEYRAKRDSGRLAPLTLAWLRPGAGEAYKAAAVSAGQREAQLKPAVLQHRKDLLIPLDQFVA